MRRPGWSIVAPALVALLASPLVAQAPASGRGQHDALVACGLDTAARWVTRQRAWLDERTTWTSDSLRRVLLDGAGASAATLDALQPGVETTRFDGVAPAADTALALVLRALARQRGAGWPTRSVVGAEGVRALWIFALRDTSVQRSIMHRLMEAGPDESFPPDVATLEDRLRIRDGRKQLYGTQLRLVNGTAEPLPTEDLAHVDLRREGALLPPLAFSRCVAERLAAASGR